MRAPQNTLPTNSTGSRARILRGCERRGEELDLAQPLARELGDPSLCAERQLHRAGHRSQLVLVLDAPNRGGEVVDRHGAVEGSDAGDTDLSVAELAAGPDELRQPVEVEEAVVAVGHDGVGVARGGLELVARHDERAPAVLAYDDRGRGREVPAVRGEMHGVPRPDQYGRGAAALIEAAAKPFVACQNAGTEMTGASVDVG